MPVAVLILPFASLIAFVAPNTRATVHKPASEPVIMAFAGCSPLMDLIRASLVFAHMGST